MTEDAKIIDELRKENVLLRQENASLRAEIALLRQKVELLVKRIFGRGSEVLSPDQLELLLGGNEGGTPMGKGDASLVEEADPRKERKARRHPRERWPLDLPVVEEILDPQEVKVAPNAWRFIGAEVSEQLDYQPAKFLRRRLIRNKYVSCKDLGSCSPVIAELPPSLQERCVAAPGLLAATIVGKYCDHLPLYRQESIFLNRHGVSLPRQSMARWMELCSDWLRPIYDIMAREVLSGGYVQVDAWSRRERRHRLPLGSPKGCAGREAVASNAGELSESRSWSNQAGLSLDDMSTARRCLLQVGNQSRCGLSEKHHSRGLYWHDPM